MKIEDGPWKGWEVRLTVYISELTLARSISRIRMATNLVGKFCRQDTLTVVEHQVQWAGQLE
jgi:hypothetical protein